MDDLTKQTIDTLWNKESYYQLIEDCHGGDYSSDRWIQAIQNLLGKKKISKLLDVGCGEGGIVKFLSQSSSPAHFYGVDVAEAGIKRAQQKDIKNAEFSVYDGDVIPYEDGFFDLSFSTFVFEHLSQPEILFAEMSRVTKDGGYILIACPNYGSPFFRSPCNKSGVLSLMFRRLMRGLWSKATSTGNFMWDHVEPIILEGDVHIMDYDTVVEPDLLAFKKYIDARGGYHIEAISSLWEEFSYGGTNKIKKIFLTAVRFLGMHNMPIINYAGPLFYIMIKKEKAS